VTLTTGELDVVAVRISGDSDWISSVVWVVDVGNTVFVPGFESLANGVSGVRRWTGSVV
jgi:hypothetical protein